MARCIARHPHPADFKTAFLLTLQHEDSTRSGKVTEDAGGRTRFGIAEKFHPDLPEGFFTGLAEDALAEAEKMNLDMVFRPPDHLEKVVTQLYETPPELVEKAKEISPNLK